MRERRIGPAAWISVAVIAVPLAVLLAVMARGPGSDTPSTHRAQDTDQTETESEGAHAGDPVATEGAVGRRTVPPSRDAATPPAGVDVAAELEAAWRHIKHGRWARAESALRRLKEAAPGNAEVWRAAGELDLQLERRDAAVISFKQAIHLQPDSAAAHFGLGASLAALGRFDEAVESLRTATSLTPKDAKAHALLALVLCRTGQTSEAIEAAEAFTDLKPSSEGYLSLAKVRAAAGDPARAAQACEKAIRLRPHNAEAHKLLGCVYARAEQYHDAIGTLRKAVELDPRDAQAYAVLALAYEASGQNAAARTTLGVLEGLDGELAATVKPLVREEKPVPEMPTVRDMDTGNLTLEEVTTVELSPRFELSEDLTMGRWSYRALVLTDKKTQSVGLAIELEVELLATGLALPPLFVDVQAKSRANRSVGSGMLFPKRMAMMEKLPYYGVITVTSFHDVDVISIRRGM